jgi:hypothetical protein
VFFTVKPPGGIFYLILQGHPLKGPLSRDKRSLSEKILFPFLPSRLCLTLLSHPLFLSIWVRIVIKLFRTSHPSGSRLIRLNLPVGWRWRRDPTSVSEPPPVSAPGIVDAPENLRFHAMSNGFVLRPYGSISNP